MSRTGGRRGGAAILLALTLPSAAMAQEFDERRFDPPPMLPDGITGVVRPGEGRMPARIDRIRDIFQAIQACWRPARGDAPSGQEITLRLAFKRNGEVLGQPRITYYKAGGEPEQREPFTRAVRETFERCTPFPFTPAFGGAVAGRPITIRFSDTRPL